MRRRHRHAVAREPQRRLDEPRPRQAPVRAPEGVEPGGQPGHGAGRRPDRVRDGLLAERDRELLHRRAGARRHSDEAVEVSHGAGRAVEVDRMAAAEEPRHDGLGDAGRERGGHDRVRRGAPVGEHLGACGRRRRMAGGDRRRPARRRAYAHATRSARRLPKRPKPASGKSKREPAASPSTSSKHRSPIARARNDPVLVAHAQAAVAQLDLDSLVARRVRPLEGGERGGGERDRRCDRFAARR